jgi:hypothetical protein
VASTQAASSLLSRLLSHFSHMSAKSAFASGSKEKEATPFASYSKEAILTSLGILTHLCDHSDHGLQISYKKYKAHLEACNTYNQMVLEGSCLGNKLTAVDLVELFVSKSFWHSHVKKHCSQVSNHSLMVEWLENGADKPSDLDVWGIQKSNYTFKDLIGFLEQAKEKRTGKGKKKMKVADKEDKDDEKKSHKKTKKQVK